MYIHIVNNPSVVLLSLLFVNCYCQALVRRPQPQPQVTNFNHLAQNKTVTGSPEKSDSKVADSSSSTGEDDGRGAPPTGPNVESEKVGMPAGNAGGIGSTETSNTTADTAALPMNPSQSKKRKSANVTDKGERGGELLKEEKEVTTLQPYCHICDCTVDLENTYNHENCKMCCGVGKRTEPSIELSLPPLHDTAPAAVVHQPNTAPAAVTHQPDTAPAAVTHQPDTAPAAVAHKPDTAPTAVSQQPGRPITSDADSGDEDGTSGSSGELSIFGRLLKNSILLLALLGIPMLFYVIYRRAIHYYQRRHYMTTQYLIDGLYANEQNPLCLSDVFSDQ